MFLVTHSGISLKWSSFILADFLLSTTFFDELMGVMCHMSVVGRIPIAKKFFWNCSSMVVWGPKLWRSEKQFHMCTFITGHVTGDDSLVPLFLLLHFSESHDERWVREEESGIGDRERGFV